MIELEDKMSEMNENPNERTNFSRESKFHENEANYQKEREDLINYLYILRQDAEPDFTREFVQNMTNKEIIKEIQKEKENQASSMYGGLNL